MKTRIGDISMQTSGVSYKPSDISDGQAPHSIAILRANNISNDGNIETSDLVWIREERIKSEQFLRDGDILLCASSGSKGLVGKAAQVNGVCGMSFGAFCKVIRPTIANKKYLGFYFQSPQYRHSISEASAGININNIRAEDLDHLEIELTDEVEQGRRCFILDKAVKAIRLRKQQIEKLNDLVKSQFIEMFGSIDESRFVPLSKVGKISTGSTPSMRIPEYYEKKEVPFIKPSDIELEVSHIYRGESAVDNRAKPVCRLFGRGTVLVTCIGTIGKIGISEIEGTCNQQINFIEPYETIDPTFLAYAIESRKTQLIEMANAPVVPIINKSLFSTFRIPLANAEAQKQFAHFVEQTDKSKIPFEMEVAA